MPRRDWMILELSHPRGGGDFTETLGAKKTLRMTWNLTVAVAKVTNHGGTSEEIKL